MNPAGSCDQSRSQKLDLNPTAASATASAVQHRESDEEGWIVARILEVPGAMSQGRTRKAREKRPRRSLRTVLTPDEDLPDKRRKPTASTCAS